MFFVYAYYILLDMAENRELDPRYRAIDTLRTHLAGLGYTDDVLQSFSEAILNFQIEHLDPEQIGLGLSVGPMDLGGRQVNGINCDFMRILVPSGEEIMQDTILLAMLHLKVAMPLSRNDLGITASLTRRGVSFIQDSNWRWIGILGFTEEQETQAIEARRFVLTDKPLDLN